MSNLHRISMIYAVLGCRWLFLLVGLLIYSLDDGNSSALLALVSIGLLTVYSLVHVQPSRIFAGALIAADLLFGLYLLSSAGGIDGPFICYCLSGLFLLKRHATWKRFYAMAAGYALLLPVVAALSAEEPLPLYAKDHAVYLVYVLIFFGASLALHVNARNLNAHFRSLAMIYSSAGPETKSDLQETVRHAESVLGKILGGREVWLCVTAPDSAHALDQSWTHTYYANSLRDNPPSSSRAYIRLPSPIGEMTPLYLRKLQDRDGNEHGWLLIKADEQELSMLQITCVQLVLMTFMNDFVLNNQLQAVQRRAAAAERDYIAQDIHDGIAQELFFLSVQLFQLKHALRKDGESEALPILSEIESKVKESHRNVRKFIVDLKGEKRRFNLRDAIERMLNRMTANSGVALDFRNNGWVAQEKIEIEEALYHFIEEAANNVMKHAGATRLHVALEVTSVQWTVVVSDDGKGMNRDEVDHGGKLGIAGMTNRIKALNGSVTIQSQASQGTTITAAIPRERSLGYV